MHKSGFFFLFLFISVLSFAQFEIHDGPYLFEEDGNWVSYRSVGDNIERTPLPANRMEAMLEVATDLPGKTFKVSLKPGLSYEQSSHDMPERLVAISDIEGNFGPFRKLLQEIGVIDENLDWSFGEGHLVLTGDFFDRGDMVTETLWLIYKLEWEAMEAGGHVHFVLGNHETMNLYGDLRYLHPKYEASVEIIGKEPGGLYSNKTELGQWLRTKNIIEKIGNILFVHAGVSLEVNKLNLSPETINQKVRPFLDIHPDSMADSDQQRLIGFSWGINWYRGYFKGDDTGTVNQTLKTFKVDHIVVGHTVVADTISTHYDGKVINIDTKHSEGKSEALLIQDGNFYRVNLNGERFPLFPKKAN